MNMRGSLGVNEQLLYPNQEPADPTVQPVNSKVQLVDPNTQLVIPVVQPVNSKVQLVDPNTQPQ